MSDIFEARVENLDPTKDEGKSSTVAKQLKDKKSTKKRK